MKKLLLILLLATPGIGMAQESAKEIKERIKDGYETSIGWKIKEGDTIILGKGSMPNKSFSFIYQSPTNYFTATSTNTYQKRYLTSNGAKRAVVNDILLYGTKKGGYTIIAKVGVGEIVKYWIEIDNALDGGEIIPPKEYSNKINPDNNASGIVVNQKLSVGDEIKKLKDLLDSGVLTQEEFDTQKKKILEQ